MLYTYAIEPDVLVTWDKCRNTLNLMGFQHGRAIAAYPSKKKWKSLVRAACQRVGTPDRDLKRILLKLREANAKLVRSDAAYDDRLQPEAERWIRNATARRTADRAFHAVLAMRNADANPDVVVEDDIDESHPKLSVSRGSYVLREPQALAEHLAVLIRNSRELVLIDPYFDPSQYRWRPIVRACIEQAGHGYHDHPRVTVHTRRASQRLSKLGGRGDGRNRPNGDPTSLDEFRDVCSRHVPDMLCDRVTSVRICRWRKRDARPGDFHARYVLTDRGGYSLDKGLDYERGVTQPVRLLDENEWKRVRDGYGQADPLFDKEGDFEITSPARP